MPCRQYLHIDGTKQSLQHLIVSPPMGWRYKKSTGGGGCFVCLSLQCISKTLDYAISSIKHVGRQHTWSHGHLGLPCLCTCRILVASAKPPLLSMPLASACLISYSHTCPSPLACVGSLHPSSPHSSLLTLTCLPSHPQHTARGEIGSYLKWNMILLKVEYDGERVLLLRSSASAIAPGCAVHYLTGVFTSSRT